MVVSENWSSNYKQKRYVWNEPQMYYATCRSADLGTNVECTTQHRWVRVFN